MWLAASQQVLNDRQQLDMGVQISEWLGAAENLI